MLTLYAYCMGCAHAQMTRMQHYPGALKHTACSQQQMAPSLQAVNDIFLAALHARHNVRSSRSTSTPRPTSHRPLAGGGVAGGIAASSSSAAGSLGSSYKVPSSAARGGAGGSILDGLHRPQAGGAVSSSAAAGRSSPVVSTTGRTALMNRVNRTSGYNYTEGALSANSESTR